MSNLPPAHSMPPAHRSASVRRMGMHLTKCALAVAAVTVIVVLGVGAAAGQSSGTTARRRTP